MRALIYLVEAAAVVLLLAVALTYVRGRMARARERRALAAARWERRLVPAGGRVRVEVAKRGVPEAVEIASLDPGADDFDERRYEAEARADEVAAGLNASDRAG